MITYREKQIEEMANDIIDNAVLEDISAEFGNDIYFVDCHTVAERLYDLGYRKMDEVTLCIDLGECPPEQINEIMEKFSNAATTPLVPAPKSEEQIRKRLSS